MQEGEELAMLRNLGRAHAAHPGNEYQSFRQDSLDLGLEDAALAGSQML